MTTLAIRVPNITVAALALIIHGLLITAIWLSLAICVPRIQLLVAHVKVYMLTLLFRRALFAVFVRILASTA